MNIKEIKISDFNYNLPDERIARYPLKQRDECKLLVAGNEIEMTDRSFNNLVDYVPSGSLMVYNNSKVINARLHFRKGDGEDGARIEIFCLDPVNPVEYVSNFAARGECEWQCFVGNSKRWKPGTVLRKTFFVDGRKVTLTAERVSQGATTSVVRFCWDDMNVNFSGIIEAIGELPIPPYLNRDTEKSDSEDYQTIYSKSEGSVAAPTAGLHFTEKTLELLAAKGIEQAEVTLHVGAGTFQPVNSETIGDHTMHFEYISVPKTLIRELRELKTTTDRKVFAVGTTSVRTLESLHYAGCLILQGKWEGTVPQWLPYTGECDNISLSDSLKAILDSTVSDRFVAETQLMIAPGFRFRIVDGMITNFHQPGSTLLLLISAFLGREDGGYDQWKLIYEHALENGYRFLSYGDACLLV